jgi:hypothetical protein
MQQPKIIAELRRIAKANGGLVRPSDILKAAMPEGSVLHPCFEWNDGKAAQEHRLWQARQLLRVTVEYVGEADEAVPIRVFVSLTNDRTSDGGYRVTSEVMNSPVRREQLLADALAEMERFQQKYAKLKELVEVFAAMRKLGRRKKAAA